jgi:hypothetical protein
MSPPLGVLAASCQTFHPPFIPVRPHGENTWEILFFCEPVSPAGVYTVTG